MTQKPDYYLPFNDLTQYVPQNLRNPVIRGLLDNLFNRQMTRDESIPMYGYVGKKPSAIDDRTPAVPQLTVERDINAITPVLNFTLGTERYAFTVQDLIRRAQTVGITSENQSWLYTQANQYLPPIDIDKFGNFYNYYWVAKALPAAPSMAWNPELLPEYYTIARPKLSDSEKPNATVATISNVVRTGTGFEDQLFTLVFAAGGSFTITADGPLGAYVSSGPTASDPYSHTYSLSASVPGASVEDSFGFPVTGPAGIVNLLSFKIVRDRIYDTNGNDIGAESFDAGDTFIIDTVFLSRNYTVTFSGSAGVKGKIKDVEALSTYQYIDGVQLQQGQRVLVKDNSSIENGIYVVGPQSWTRAADYDGTNITAGARVWVSSGATNAGKLFTSGLGNSWDTGVLSDSNTSDWQEGNFWIHGNDLASLDLTRTSVVQGTRPIIEYNSTLRLNSFIKDGAPSDAGTSFKQLKTEFNQLPMFDLFRYDGTHSGLVSAVFYYVEDLSADLDVALQKRVRLSSSDSADYIFDHGLTDADGDLLFYKLGTALKTIWHPGYSEATVVDSTFIGTAKGEIVDLIPTTIAVPQTWTLTATSATTFSVSGSVTGSLPTLTVGIPYTDLQFSLTVNVGTIPFLVGESFTFSIAAGPVLSPIVFSGNTKGTITSITASHFTQQQVWSLRATSPTTFEVSGSKTSALPAPYDVLTVGVPYSSSEFSCMITAGTEPFALDDLFTFRIGNLEMPRYVHRDSTGTIYDLYGGKSADTAGIGAYQVPRTFKHNPYNESRSEILEGTLYSHFRGILQNQLPELPANYAFGGSIKGWSEQHTLLASLLMQEDLTPISMIDTAQRQYETALNTIADLYQKTIVQYYATTGVVDIDGTAEQAARLDALLDALLVQRSSDHDVRTVLYDTTSSVIGFPPTLPQLGIAELVQPRIEYNNELGRQQLTHHDGHGSALYIDDLSFRRAILKNSADLTVTRSDGSVTPAVGSFTNLAPANPYKGELWIRPNGAESEMLAFDVASDSEAPAGAAIGTRWYDRGSQVLSVWDGANWVAQPTLMAAWRVVDLAVTLNEVLLAVETRLFNGINPNARKVDFVPLEADALFNEEMKRELFAFAALNSLDPLGSDYNPSDAFTWKYSLASTASFAPLSSAAVPARWIDIITKHQETVAGVIPTDRPNLDPWKLLGFSTKDAWVSTLTPFQLSSYTPYKTPSDLNSMISAGTVRAAKTTGGATSLAGLQTIDGVPLNAGDRVLLQNEPAAANSGIWVVSAGLWSRAAVPLLQDTYVTVSSGARNFGTVWALSATVGTLNIDPVLFKQVRSYSDALWSDIQAARPTLRLSVDTVRDALLPPYVSSSSLQASNALTNTVPSGAGASYQYGESSAVETFWRHQVGYQYSKARALFRYDPLQFLGFCFGFNWVQVDGVTYDGYDLNTPGHKRFRLHGEPVRSVQRDFTYLSTLGTAPTWAGTGSDLTITYDAYEVSGLNRYQNFSVRENGSVIAYIREGVPASIVTSSGILQNFLIEDFGKPFHIGDTFTVLADGTITFAPASTYKYLGFGQVFTQALREISIDTNDSYAIDAFRGWDVQMGHRAGGLVATDDLKVRTDADTLSTSSYDLIVKKNTHATDLWIQGLRCTVLTFGTGVTAAGGLAPATDGSDWIFRIEGYNPRYSKISYYGTNTSGAYETFNVLDQADTMLAFKHYGNTGLTIDSHLPLTITGIQNVSNFLFAYSEYLVDQGWIFNQDPTASVDAETGRARTWQLEVEKFIAVLYRGVQPGQGHVVNPFMDQLWIRQDTGILSQFANSALYDVTGNSGVYDITGTRFDTSSLTVIRGNQRSQFGAAAPMFSAHAQLDEFEHLFIMKYFVEDSLQNGLLYDPFSGSGVITYKFNGRRQASSTLRPEFGGHYLVGNEVRQNLQASTENITSFYDANKAFDNEQTSKHALALLGFNTKSYFSDLDISDKSQFNFWRGLIQAKGTNSSIAAYLNNARFEDARIDEYWAYKVAEYGDARQKAFPELKLFVNDTLQQFTQLQFDADIGSELPNFTQIQKFDEDRWFSIDDAGQDAYFKAEIVGSFARDAVVDELYDLPFVADKLTLQNCVQINATTVKATGTPVSVVGYGAATPRYNPLKLLNYIDRELVSEIPYWHPARGQHTPTALESINIISSQNPAKYNFSTQVANNNSYDPLRPWGSNELGRTWFDTTNLAYIPYYDQTVFSDRPERLSRWGALADFATIDVYEWVQSTVKPSEYNALALIQAGNADLASSEKAAGEVALEESYSRTREWSIRPIAWSEAGVPIEAAHPTFPNSYDQQLYINGDLISLEAGLFSDHGITAGMRIGAWSSDENNLKPLSEAVILDRFTKEIVGAPLVVPNFTVSVSVVAHTALTGQLLVTGGVQTVPRTDANGDVIGYEYSPSISIRNSTFSMSETASLGTVYEVLPSAGIPDVTYDAGQTFTYSFVDLGLDVTVAVGASGTYGGDAIQQAIVDALGTQLQIRDAVYVTAVAGWPGAYSQISNNILDSSYVTNLGWRAWNVPTQAQLDADSRQPNSRWKPYLGDFVPFTASLEQIQDAVLYSAAPFTLNDGTVIQKYSTSWSDWGVLRNTVLNSTQVTAGPAPITHSENIVSSMTSVYVNGITQLAAAYTILGKTLTVTSVPAGSTVTVVIRHYEPSAAELAFDPSTADDLTYQVQYKKDYEYVSLPVRDVDGTITSTTYYFWVKNKSTAANGKKLSIQSIARELRDGPPNYMTFQNLIGTGTSADSYRYDAITISGLSYVVQKDDTFKLRFTRDFTLRDDPQQLELKDTHTEWSLLRPSQRTRIPESLWQKLVDSVSGQDAAANAVPALRRVLYDERNGTRTRFGFNAEQTLAPQDLLVSSITYTIVNTKLVNTNVPVGVDGQYPPDFIEFLDFDQSAQWFATPEAARQTMTDIWTSAKPSQINEIFFAALNDILANNYELTDIFKTSRLSAYSIKVIGAAPAQPTYE